MSAAREISHRSPQPGARAAAGQPMQRAGGEVQRRALRGMSFDEGAAALAPKPENAGATPEAKPENAGAAPAASPEANAPAAAPSAHPILRPGARGDEVGEMQLKLDAAGVSDEGLAIDEVYGALTQQALLRFQRSRGLVADGVCGPKTWAALDAVSGSRVVTTAEAPEVFEKKAAADKLRLGGAYAAAMAVYLELYQRPNLPPEWRGGTTFSLGGCAHALGRFDEAIGYYQEFIELPVKGDDGAVPDALQRIRECRLGQPPGTLASKGGGPTEGDMAPLVALKQEADGLYQGGAYGAARDKYNQIYAHPNAVPEQRSGTTFRLGACEQELGNFSKAISYYNEFMELPGLDAGAAPDALERIRECRAGKKPGTLTTKGGGPTEPADMSELESRKQAADDLRHAGDFAAAKSAYLEIYQRKDATPELRGGTTFSLGSCEQGLGNYPDAIGWYQEFMQLPGGQGHMDKRDALQRIRECRAGKAPGTLETKLAEQGKVAD